MNSDSDVRANCSGLGAIDEVSQKPPVISTRNLTKVASDNSQEKHPKRPTKRPTRKGKICRCGVKLQGVIKRCRKCEAKYRRERRDSAKYEETVIDFSINIVARPDKTFGVLVVSSRIDGDEASRGKLYGPYATRKEAQDKAALVDQALEVWGLANGW